MLVQWFRREVPDHDVFIQRAAVVHPTFGVTALWLNGLAQDWGAQSEVVSFMERLQRGQLSILLEGQGYFAMPEGPLLLSTGDVIESDQRLRQVEGYWGRPALVVVIEWDDDSVFGPAHRGPARHSRLGPRDVLALRELVARLHRTPLERWVAELVVRLHALGLRVEREAPPPVPFAPEVAPMLDAMGHALSRLDTYPSLDDIADALAIGERQARRRFRELHDGYRMPHGSWRQFLSDARLGWVTQLLSIPGLTQAQIVALSGFRSPVALAHAFSGRGACTPGQMRRELAARWR